MKPSTVLLRALAKLGPNGERWIQGSFAKSADGRCVGTRSQDATCWCAAGATMAVADCLSSTIARGYLSFVMDGSISHFNDDKRRRFVSIHKAFLRAIRMAKDGGR